MISENVSANFSAIAFYLFAALALGFAAMVAFGRNIIYSGFGLLGCFTGVAGLYVLLAADYVGVLQIFVYVGGITVLIIFAVMFTNEIGDVRVTNQSMNWKQGLIATAVMFALLRVLISGTPWMSSTSSSGQLPDESTVEAIGDLLLTKYLLPFEVISWVLLVVLVGAIVLARRAGSEKRT